MIDLILGLDLGQRKDYSALCVVQREFRPSGERHYGLRYLKRWPLGTGYPEILSDLATLLRNPIFDQPKLAVDITGVGLGVFDFVKQSGLPVIHRPILITAGSHVTNEAGCYHVPKKELVSVLQVLLQSRRLRVANIPERELLVKELLQFKVKVSTAGNESFEAWRERDHDDLVLAVAMALWLGEREKGSFGSYVPPEVEEQEERRGEWSQDPMPGGAGSSIYGAFAGKGRQATSRMQQRGLYGHGSAGGV